MYVAKDSLSHSNLWLTLRFGSWLWAREKEDAFKFTTEAEALKTGREAMPTPDMAKRVIAEPA